VDPERKATLDLIEAAVAYTSVAVRGKQLLYVVRDYVEDGDLIYARTVLAKVDSSYFSKYIYQHAVEDSLFAEAVAVVVRTFGTDLQYFQVKPVIA